MKLAAENTSQVEPIGIKGKKAQVAAQTVEPPVSRLERDRVEHVEADIADNQKRLERAAQLKTVSKWRADLNTWQWLVRYGPAAGRVRNAEANGPGPFLSSAPGEAAQTDNSDNEHQKMSSACCSVRQGHATEFSIFALTISVQTITVATGNFERRRIFTTPVRTEPPTTFVSLEQEVYLALQRVALGLQHETSEMLKSYDLSAPQFNILRILRGAAGEGRSGLAAAQIGERLLAYAPDLTRLLDRMVLRGLVVRERQGRDRRVVTTSITEKGLALLAALDAPLAALHQKQLSHLGPERLNALLLLLGALHQGH